MSMEDTMCEEVTTVEAIWYRKLVAVGFDDKGNFFWSKEQVPGHILISNLQLEVDKCFVHLQVRV